MHAELWINIQCIVTLMVRLEPIADRLSVLLKVLGTLCAPGGGC